MSLARLLSFLLLFIRALPAREKKCHFRSSYIQPFQSSPDQKKVGSKSTYRVPKKVQCFWQVHKTIVQTFPLFAEFRCKPKNWLFFKLESAVLCHLFRMLYAGKSSNTSIKLSQKVFAVLYLAQKRNQMV